MSKYIVLNKSIVKGKKQYKTALKAFEEFSKDPQDLVMLQVIAN